MTPLVAVAHGSRDPRAAAVIEKLLLGVRELSGNFARHSGQERDYGLRVVSSYLDHAAPAPGQALGGLAEEGVGGVAVLPLLLTDAYHSKVDIPAVLARVRGQHPRLQLHYGRTLGPDPLLLEALERRLAEAGVRPDPDTAVVLAAAGSSDPAANAVIAEMARQWRHKWLDVVPAFASAARPEPAVAVRALLSAGARRVVVASYFLAPGYFADKVEHDCLAAGASVVSPVFGAAPEIARLVLRRYTATLARATPEPAPAIAS